MSKKKKCCVISRGIESRFICNSKKLLHQAFLGGRYFFKTDPDPHLNFFLPQLYCNEKKTELQVFLRNKDPGESKRPDPTGSGSAIMVLRHLNKNSTLTLYIRLEKYIAKVSYIIFKISDIICGQLNVDAFPSYAHI